MKNTLARELALTAIGQSKADTVILGADMINVHTGEIEQGKDIAVKKGHIVLVGNVQHALGENTEIIEGQGYTLAPGFIDAHLHVESSMVNVTEFSRGVMPRGTTAIFMDPHEMANVMGVEGVLMMVEEGKHSPLRVFSTVPSCVPAHASFEDTGASMGPDDIARAFQESHMVALGEVMNFPGVIYGDPQVHEILALTDSLGKQSTGHYASNDLLGLQAYIAAGIVSCHESTTKIDALTRMRLGMYAKLREGSAWLDLKETIRALTEEKIQSRFAILVSDDVHPQTLLSKGHMDHIIRRAIEEGLDPITAIQMATLNPAQCFQMNGKIGSIAPGRYADIVFLRDVETVQVAQVMIGGEMVAKNETLTKDVLPFTYPPHFYHTVNPGITLTPNHFQIPVPKDVDKVKAHVIQVCEGSIKTKHSIRELALDSNGLIIPEDLAILLVLERHHGKQSWSVGLVEGFNLKDGAVASTVAHDSHNLIIMGKNKDDMALAGNYLVEQNGGMVSVQYGGILAFLPLSLAGLMSSESIEDTSQKVDELEKSWRQLGCAISSPFMMFSMLSLPVIPALRLTNRGLVDTETFQYIELFS